MSDQSVKYTPEELAGMKALRMELTPEEKKVLGRAQSKNRVSRLDVEEEGGDDHPGRGQRRPVRHQRQVTRR